jgi:hypothetical protein
MVDPPASLEFVWCVSSAGRGILEAGLFVKAGIFPRLCSRFGVPLIVPREAMAGVGMLCYVL